MFDFFVWTAVLDKLVYSLDLMLRWEMWPRGLSVESQMTCKQGICFMVLDCVLKLRQIVDRFKLQLRHLSLTVFMSFSKCYLIGCPGI